MDGKQNLKVFNKMELLSNMRITNCDADIRVKTAKNFTPITTAKRSSMTIITARSTSTLNKKINPTVPVKRLKTNNYMSSTTLRTSNKQIF